MVSGTSLLMQFVSPQNVAAHVADTCLANINHVHLEAVGRDFEVLETTAPLKGRVSLRR